MAHLTLDLSAAIVVPFGIKRRHPTGPAPWKARSIREASQNGGSLPLLVALVGRQARGRRLLSLHDEERAIEGSDA